MGHAHQPPPGPDHCGHSNLKVSWGDPDSCGASCLLLPDSSTASLDVFREWWVLLIVLYSVSSLVSCSSIFVLRIPSFCFIYCTANALCFSAFFFFYPNLPSVRENYGDLIVRCPTVKGKWVDAVAIGDAAGKGGRLSRCF